MSDTRNMKQLKNKTMLGFLSLGFLFLNYNISIAEARISFKPVAQVEPEGQLNPHVNLHLAKDKKPDKKEIENTLRKVVDWQKNYYSQNGYEKWLVIEWVYSTYYVGLQKVADVLDDQGFHNDVLEYSKKANWKVGEGKRRFFADDYLIGDIYAKSYQKYKDPVMIDDFRNMADELIANKKDEPLKVNYKTMNVFRVWNWCDAMFMAPPSLFSLSNVTQENKYRDLADSLFWKTYDYLYDKNDHLYYRDSRFFDFREKNGQKQFWSRGNGWVLAGLARILEQLPEKHPKRKRYEVLFKEMAEKVSTLQQSDGMWRSSLLAPELYSAKESSGTGFYCYALAWGVNNKLLNRKVFRPVVLKAWNALTNCIQSTGKLGYVQKIGDKPEPATTNDTAGFGVGAFLLAGSEVYHLK